MKSWSLVKDTAARDSNWLPAWLTDTRHPSIVEVDPIRILASMQDSAEVVHAAIRAITDLDDWEFDQLTMRIEKRSDELIVVDEGIDRFYDWLARIERLLDIDFVLDLARRNAAEPDKGKPKTVKRADLRHAKIAPARSAGAYVLPLRI